MTVAQEVTTQIRLSFTVLQIPTFIDELVFYFFTLDLYQAPLQSLQIVLDRTYLSTFSHWAVLEQLASRYLEPKTDNKQLPPPLTPLLQK
jgi:hypothetical protein